MRRLRGDTRLRETLVIPKNETLVIDAGTTVQLDPDVSILSYGQVVIRGTSAHPVTFVPTIKGKPWGTFALQGEGANGSKRQSTLKRKESRSGLHHSLVWSPDRYRERV